MSVLSENFISLIEDLTTYSKAQSEGLLNKGNKTGFLQLKKRSNYPAPLNPLNVPELGSGASNDGVQNPNELYQQILNNKDENGKFKYYTAADGMAVTMQGDYLAAVRRSYVLLHASTIRRRAWSAARLKGHGTTKSGLFTRVQDQVNAVINSGANYSQSAYNQTPPQVRLAQVQQKVTEQLAKYGFKIDNNPYSNLTDWKPNVGNL